MADSRSVSLHEDRRASGDATAPSSLAPYLSLALAALLLLTVALVRNRAVNLDPIFYQRSSHGYRALVLYLSGRYAPAARAYRQHFATQVPAGHSTLSEPEKAILTGDLERAEGLGRLLAGAGNVQGLLVLGEVALERGHPQEALGFAREALTRERGQVDALVLTAVAQTRLGAAGPAIDALNLALRQNRLGKRTISFLALLETTGQLAAEPTATRPECLLAHYYRYLRPLDPANASLAEAAALRAIARGDHPADAHLTLGVIYEKRGELDRALETYRHASEVEPGYSEGFRRVAVMYRNRGDIAGEYRMIRAAVEAAPGDSLALAHLRDLLLDRLGDAPAAIEALERVLAREPANMRATVDLAYAYATLGDAARAADHYRKATEVAPFEPTTWEGLGWALDRLGRDEMAIAAYERALAVGPRRWEAHRGLGHLYDRQHRYNEAIAEYRLALQRGDPLIETHRALCLDFYAVSDFERAADCFRAALKRDPGSTALQRYVSESEYNVRLRRAAPR